MWCMYRAGRSTRRQCIGWGVRAGAHGMGEHGRAGHRLARFKSTGCPCMTSGAIAGDWDGTLITVYVTCPTVSSPCCLCGVWVASLHLACWGRSPHANRSAVRRGHVTLGAGGRAHLHHGHGSRRCHRCSAHSAVDPTLRSGEVTATARRIPRSVSVRCRLVMMVGGARRQHGWLERSHPVMVGCLVYYGVLMCGGLGSVSLLTA